MRAYAGLHSRGRAAILYFYVYLARASGAVDPFLTCACVCARAHVHVHVCVHVCLCVRSSGFIRHA